MPLLDLPVLVVVTADRRLLWYTGDGCPSPRCITPRDVVGSAGSHLHHQLNNRVYAQESQEIINADSQVYVGRMSRIVTGYNDL